MLDDKDYCDYETSVALYECGYDCLVIHLIAEKITLYEAQKWLREEKNIIVDVRYGAQYYNVVLNRRITCGRYIVMDKNNRIADFTKYEEALSEGIKEAVKYLKDGIGE